MMFANKKQPPCSGCQTPGSGGMRLNKRIRALIVNSGIHSTFCYDVSVTCVVCKKIQNIFFTSITQKSWNKLQKQLIL